MEHWLKIDAERYLNMANADAVTFSRDRDNVLSAHVHFDGGHVKIIEGKAAERLEIYLLMIEES